MKKNLLMRMSLLATAILTSGYLNCDDGKCFNKKNTPIEYFNPTSAIVELMRPNATMLINFPGFIEPVLDKETLTDGLTQLTIRVGEIGDRNNGFSEDEILIRNKERRQMIIELVKKGLSSSNGITPLMLYSIALAENGGTFRLSSDQTGTPHDTFGSGVTCRVSDDQVGLTSYSEELDSATGNHEVCSLVTVDEEGAVTRLRYDPVRPGELLALFDDTNTDGIWGMQALLYHRALIEYFGAAPVQYLDIYDNYYNFRDINFHYHTLTMIQIILNEPYIDTKNSFQVGKNQAFWNEVFSASLES